MNECISQQLFDIGEGSKVSLSLSSGDLEVTGWEKGQLAVESPDGQVSVHQHEDTWHIVAPHGGAGDLMVRVPYGTDLDLRLASGDAHLRNIIGAVEIKMASGDVDAEGLQGSLRAKTLSGDLRLRRCRLDTLCIDSKSGTSTVETPLSKEGEYSIHQLSGALRLRLPVEQACTVQARLLSGHFHCKLPHETESASRHNVCARVNGGGVEFRIHILSGDVYIEPGEMLPETEAAMAQAERQARPLWRSETGASHETRPLQSEPPLKDQPVTDAEISEEPFALDEAEPFHVEEAPTLSLEAQRMAILKDIEEGRLTVDEGLARLRALE